MSSGNQTVEISGVMRGTTLSRSGLQRSVRLAFAVALLAAIAVMPIPAGANATAQTLPFSQNWTDTGLIITNDDWSGVPGVVGYRGDGLTSANDVDPQTVLSEGTPMIDVNANQTTPNTFTTGGVTEFHITDPAVRSRVRAPRMRPPSCST